MKYEETEDGLVQNIIKMERGITDNELWEGLFKLKTDVGNTQ